MIGVRLHGRLGNQLFQYAFAYAMAKKYKTVFYLDKRLSQDFLSKYFLITQDKFRWLDRFIFSIKTKNGFFTSYMKLGFYSKIRYFLKLENIELSNNEKPEVEMLKGGNNKLYSGFFQSEIYFNHYKDDLLKQFQLNHNAIEQFKNTQFNLPDDFKSVVVHVRRTDYIEYNYDLPMDYFHHAIANIQDSKNFYIIISDDPTFASEEFNYLPNKYISNNNEIIDFQLLMQADICILSNSSFSWWGAYLNQKATTVIAPKYWLGYNEKKEYPSGIIPKHWIEFENL